jgi:hypothetical protein
MISYYIFFSVVIYSEFYLSVSGSKRTLLGLRKSENSIGFQEVIELYWVSGSKRTLLGFRKSENSIGFQEVRELYWVSGKDCEDTKGIVRSRKSKDRQ